MKQNNTLLILTLGIFNALTPFSIDMYLSSFPSIAKDLGVPVAQMALSVSFYFIGFALGQVLYGPFLDRFGRKKPLYIGLALYIAATFGCMTAQSFDALLLFRFLSALGGCAAGVAATTMVRDFFPPEQTAKVFSLLMLVLSVSPLLAPTIGSLLVAVASWRTIFAVLAGLGILNVVLLATVIPNTYAPDSTVKLKPKPILQNFKKVFLQSQFFTYTLAGSLGFAGLFVYVAASPAIFMEGFGLSAQGFGVVFGVLVFGMIGGGQVNLLMVKRHGERQVFKTFLIAEVAVSALFLAGTMTNTLGLYGTVAMMFVILFCVGATYPNAAALALEPFTSNVGSASALLGFIQLGIGSIVSAGVGMLDMKGSLPTALAIFVASTIGLMLLLSRHKLHLTEKQLSS